MSMVVYRNLLLFHCENIFVQRKHTKIFYTNIILQRTFSCRLVPYYTQVLPQLLLPIYPLCVVVSNTASHLLSLPITSARGAISSINAHHTRLVKLFSSNLVCLKIILCEYFCDENLLGEKITVSSFLC